MTKEEILREINSNKTHTFVLSPTYWDGVTDANVQELEKEGLIKSCKNVDFMNSSYIYIAFDKQPKIFTISMGDESWLEGV